MIQDEKVLFANYLIIAVSGGAGEAERLLFL